MAFWPWWAPIAFLVAYELYAVRTQLRHTRRVPTLSELMWRLSDRAPWLKWAALALVAVLWLHFYAGLWR